MGKITGLDHVIIAVEDLAASDRMMRRLGFLTTPRGVHSPHKGTANLTAVLSDRATYVELLGIVTPTELNVPVRDALAAGERLFGIALKTSDAAAASERFAAGGVGTGVLNAFSRPVETPLGAEEAAFRTTFTTREGAAGLFVFACEHLTPHLVWREDFLRQPNGVTGIAEVIGFARDPEATAAAFARIAPDAPQSTDADGVAITLADSAVVIHTHDAYAKRIGETPHAETGLGALVLRTAGLEATESALQAGGVPFRREDGRIIVAGDDALGVTLIFKG